MTDIERIAAGLTKVQREALCEGWWNVGSMCLSLIDLGIVVRQAGWGYSVSLDHFGLAVRAHLIAQEKGDE